MQHVPYLLVTQFVHFGRKPYFNQYNYFSAFEIITNSSEEGMLYTAWIVLL